MKNKYLIRLGSFRAIEALLEKTETSIVPGLPAARAAFVMAIKHAEALQQRQALRLAPVLERRNAAFRRLAAVTLRVAGLAVSHAARQGEKELVARLQLRPRALLAAALERRLAAAQGMHDVVVELQPMLAEAGITAEAIAELAEALAEAREQLAEPRSHVVARMDATASLGEQFSELGAIVRLQLDPLFHPLRLTQPALYRQYRAARKQIHRPATRERDETNGETPAGSTPVVNLSTNPPNNAAVQAAA